MFLNFNFSLYVFISYFRWHQLLRVKKKAKYLTKTFAFGDFWKEFCGKNFREFKVREMLLAPKKKKHQVLL